MIVFSLPYRTVAFSTFFLTSANEKSVKGRSVSEARIIPTISSVSPLILKTSQPPVCTMSALQSQ